MSTLEATTQIESQRGTFDRQMERVGWRLFLVISAHSPG
jgi:hypothetical protein